MEPLNLSKKREKNEYSDSQGNNYQTNEEIDVVNNNGVFHLSPAQQHQIQNLYESSLPPSYYNEILPFRHQNTVTVSGQSSQYSKFNDNIKSNYSLVSTPEQSPSTTSNISSHEITERNAISRINRPFKSITADTIFIECPEMQQQFLEFCNQHGNIEAYQQPIINERMKRVSRHFNNCEKSREYLEKRLKNNEAAKKSRDSRKKKEDHLAMLLMFFKKELYKKQSLIAVLENENEELKNIIANRKYY